MNGHSNYDYARDDAKFLKNLASSMTYNDGDPEAFRKHRLYEIAMRLETKFYVPSQPVKAAKYDAMSQPRERVYISGPMTGMPEHNFPAFNAEAARLRALGYQVINPAEINPDGTKPWKECLREDIKHLCDCDTIALLPGWENSQGAHLELHISHRIGSRIVQAKDLR